MDLIRLMLSSDSGLLSAGVILFIILMALYLYVRLRKLMNQDPGKQGWT